MKSLHFNFIIVSTLSLFFSFLAFLYQEIQFVHAVLILTTYIFTLFILKIKLIVVKDFGLVSVLSCFFYWYFIPCGVKYLQNGYDDFINYSSFYYAFFLMQFAFFFSLFFMFILRGIRWIKYYPDFRKPVKDNNNFFLLAIAFILPIYPGNLFFSLFKLDDLAIRNVLVESGALNNKLGTADKFFEALFSYFNVFSGVYLAVCAFAKKPFNKFQLIYGLVVLLLIVFLSGTRSYSFFFLFTISLVIYFNKIKVKIYFALPFLLIFVFLIGLLGFTRDTRVGVSDIESTKSEIISTVLTGDNNFFDELLYGVIFVENKNKLTYEDPVLIFLTQFIPRSIWNNKPTSVTVREITFERWGIDTDEGAGNVLSGIIGQFYIGLGLFGVIYVSLIIAFLALLVNRISVFIQMDFRKNINLIFLILLMSAFFLSFRSLSQSHFMPLFVSIFFYKIFSGLEVPVKLLLKIRSKHSV